MQLRGKVLVVTGGGNGIGREVVLQLLRAGSRVAAVDLRAESLAETAALAGDVDGRRLSTHTVDVADREAVQALVDEVLGAHGQVDGLLNVAGIIQPFVHVADLEWSDIEKVMAVNFLGVLHTCKAFLPLLTVRPEACLLNVSSMGALAPVPGQAVYGASKAAVKLLTEALYAELRDSSVAVTVVFPGAIGTEITKNSAVEVPGSGSRDTSAAAARTTTPEDAGRQVVEAVQKGPYRVTIGRDATMLDKLSRLAPQRATDLIAKKMADLLG